MSNAAQQMDPVEIIACTIAADLNAVPQLVDQMETEFGENWGDLRFEEVEAFLSSPVSDDLEIVTLAIMGRDEDMLIRAANLINLIKDKDIYIVLVTKDVSAPILHQLMRLGADEFVPYPVPDGALNDSVERRSRLDSAPAVNHAAVAQPNLALASMPAKNGSVFAIQGLCGGAGATTFAVNLAHELATLDKKNPKTVCFLDLDFQFGSAATYLDLPRKDAVLEMLTNAEDLDEDVFSQALVGFSENMHVLTAPADVLPLDIVGPDEIRSVIDNARTKFDFVVVDMPKTLVQWTETVMDRADVHFALMEMDMRSAQNALRLVRALKAEDLPFEKIKYVLNRAPKFTDLSGKSRAKKMAESLEISLELHLPDGGLQVSNSCDHGQPLGVTAAKNPLRKEIAKLAQSLAKMSDGDSGK
ncbi:ATPase, putative [Rhodobacterales bacterium HTCC2150]|nr:ATPase, putative [Rhodobacterales bacterium HTCC2150] [Rhodobacteraceae bacterium HTCC2150]